MANRLFWAQSVNRALDVEGISGAQVFFFESGTTTQRAVYQDAELTLAYSQPVLADSDGVFPDIYPDASGLYRVLMRDADGVNLPGYPVDGVVVPAVIATAADIPFSPTEGNDATNVQDAILNAGASTEDSADLIARYFTPYVTGGSTNAYTITPSPAITSYVAGQGFTVRPDRTNTGAATLNVNGIGAVSIKKTNTSGTPTALVAGDIYAGREFFVYDDGTQMLMSLGRDYPIRTSNANGDATVFPDGTLICRKSTFAMDYNDAGTCVGTWTCPVPFSTATGLSVSATLCPPIITSNGSTVASGGGNVSKTLLLSPVVGGGTGTTTIAVRVHCMLSALTFFQPGNSVYCSIIAIGRWF
jgi:hypothetical protein